MLHCAEVPPILGSIHTAMMRIPCSSCRCRLWQHYGWVCPWTSFELVILHLYIPSQPCCSSLESTANLAAAARLPHKAGSEAAVQLCNPSSCLSRDALKARPPQGSPSR